MTAVTKGSIPILPATPLTAALTGSRSAPGIVGLWIDVREVNGGVLGGRIENTGGAVGVAGILLWQWTPDKDAAQLEIYDLWEFCGALAAGAKETRSIRLDKEIKWVRAVCWGNTTNTVTYKTDLAAGS